jgi:hypothetical protein
MKHLKEIAFALILTCAAIMASPWASAHDTEITLGSLVIEQPWLRVMDLFPPALYKHRFGT